MKDNTMQSSIHKRDIIMMFIGSFLLLITLGLLITTNYLYGKQFTEENLNYFLLGFIMAIVFVWVGGIKS